MRLDGLAATAKACLEGMDLEVEFNSALGRVRGYRLFTQHLELLDEDDRVVARFESRNLE
jgi:heat shock protein HslJ